MGRRRAGDLALAVSRERGTAGTAAGGAGTSSRYVAVEGVIGVGKTTLAKRLSRSMGGNLVLEVVEENPFLARFYDDPEAWAFQTQLFFLLSRYKQQLQIPQRELFAQSVVSDYIFAKDQIFATINLGEEELALYRTIVPLLEARVTRPDLVIYLQATTEVLLERIRRRGRSFEREISREYLETLSEAYNHFFFHYEETPLLIVNTNEMDLVGIEGDYDRLLEMIREHASGTRYVGVK
jgi:deoxyadenosine/deoxycytidine kinase